MDWLIFGSINLIVVVILFLFLSRRLHRQYNSEKFLADVQQEVNAIITELNHTTERNLQLIEDRMEALSALTAQLDRRILMVKNDEERRSESSGTYNQLQEQHRQIQRDMARSQATVVPPKQVLQKTLPPTELKIDSANQIEQAYIQVPTPLEPTESIQEAGIAQPVISSDSRHVRTLQARELMKTQVVDMFKAGIASTLIAQHFEISLGEVELIISLQTGRQT